MTQIGTTSHHLIAVDIAKETFEVLSAEGSSLQVANDPAGLRRLLKWLESLPDPMVVCEATGAAMSGLYWPCSTGRRSPWHCSIPKGCGPLP